MKNGLNVKLICSFVAIAVIALFTFSFVHLFSLKSRYSVEQFFPKEHPVLREHLELTKKFQLNKFSPVMVLLEIPKGSWLEAKNIKLLNSWTDQAEKLFNVNKVTTFSNVEAAFTVGDELRIGRLSQVVPEKQWRDQLEAVPVLKQFFHQEHEREVLVTVEPKIAANAEIAKMMKALEKSLGAQTWKAKVQFSGVPAIQSQLAGTLEKEVVKYLALCLVLFCLIFLAFYRNFAIIGISAGYLAVANVTTLGLMSYFGFYMSVLSSTLPMIVSIATVSLMIHTFHLWSTRIGKAPNAGLGERWRMSIACIKEIALANFLGSMTTAVGFAALALTPIPMIKEYAWIVAGSIFWVYFIVQVLFVITLPFYTPELRHWTEARAGWTLAIFRKALPICVGVIALVVVCGGLATRMNFSSRLFDDLTEKHPLNVALKRIDHHFGGIVTLEMALEAKSEKFWLQPANMAKLARAVSEARKIEGVGSVMAVTDFLTPAQMKSQGAAAEALFLYSMSPADPMKQFIDPDQKAVRLAIRLKDLPGADVAQLRAHIKKAIAAQGLKVGVTEGGLALHSHVINQEVSHELVYGFWISVAMIGALLTLIFRSVRWAFVACLPNLVPPAVLMGTLALLQTPIKPAIGLIFSIALGLAFNNTVYLLARLKGFYRDGNKHLPVRRAFWTEGNPCLSESLLTFVGFMIFLTSDFKMNQIFGAYMILSIFAGFLGDLVFLPAFLKLFPRLLTRPAKVQPDSESKRDPVVPSSAAAAALTALMFVSLASSKTEAAPAKAPAKTSAVKAPAKASEAEAVELLQKIRDLVESKSDQAKVTLKIIEANGDTKTRVLNLQSLKEKDTYYALVRVQSPADVKGTALLAEVQKDQENQWLYLPSTKQVRRVVSSKKSGGVLGSELSPDDLNSTAVQGATVSIYKKDAVTTVLNIRPKKGTSLYSTVLMTVSNNENQPLKLEYFDGKKPFKTVEFQDYAVINGVHRAQKISIKNLTNQRGTEVQLEDIKINVGLKAQDFSVNALKR